MKLRTAGVIFVLSVLMSSIINLAIVFLTGNFSPGLRTVSSMLLVLAVTVMTVSGYMIVASLLKRPQPTNGTSNSYDETTYYCFTEE